MNSTELKDATTTTNSKISDVSNDVSGVKTDVTTVKADVASTQSELEKTGSDLKRVMGDMGVMSGLIATNSKDLNALRELGERNYYEFDLKKAALTTESRQRDHHLEEVGSKAQSLYGRGGRRRQAR